MSDIIAKAKVVLTALPTYLALATLVLTVAADELVPLLPDNVAAQVAGYIVVALGIIAAVVRTISRLTPVPESQRGLLPAPTGEPVVRDLGESTVVTILAVLAIVVLVAFLFGWVR